MFSTSNHHSHGIVSGAPALILVLAALLLFANVSRIDAQTSGRRLIIAVLDFGGTTFARDAADKLSSNLKVESTVHITDRDQTRAAARGAA